MQGLQLLVRVLQSQVQGFQSQMLGLQMQVRRYAQALVIVAQPFVKITQSNGFKVFIIAIITLPAKGMFFAFVKSTSVISG